MPTHIPALFLLIFVLTAASSWFLQTLFGAAPQDATEILDIGVSQEPNPNTQKMLGALESLFAEFTTQQNNANPLTRFRDFGTRLDVIFDADPIDALNATHGSYTDFMLVQSFPGRDITTALQILACYRHYRLELANASTEVAQDSVRHTLRTRYFGREMADILFAAEYQMLAAFDGEMLGDAPAPPAEGVSDCFGNGLS